MHVQLTRDRIASLLALARGKRIVIIGDAMLDVYLSGDVERISPEAPVPVVRVKERRYALGGAANVAQNAAVLGCGIDFVAAVGDDANGRILRQMLSSMGAGTESLVTVDRETTVKTRIVARSQQLLRVDEEDDADLSGEDVARLLQVATAALDGADALVLEDYNKGVLVSDVIARTIEVALQRKIPIIVDPKHRNFFAYRGATIFKPNRRELNAAVGATLAMDDLSVLPEIAERLGVDHLLLTLGEHGMTLVSAGGEIGRVPTVAPRGLRCGWSRRYRDGISRCDDGGWRQRAGGGHRGEYRRWYRSRKTRRGYRERGRTPSVRRGARIALVT